MVEISVNKLIRWSHSGMQISTHNPLWGQSSKMPPVLRVYLLQIMLLEPPSKHNGISIARLAAWVCDIAVAPSVRPTRVAHANVSRDLRFWLEISYLKNARTCLELSFYLALYATSRSLSNRLL